ncbi:hypothetical protein CVT26_012292 [Gymnopilus dilepis]|uniref:Cell division control protein 14 n=1 Tax=Gymnopilus dilepis TaxID=231916 RepID=A0A409YQE2_9AGAR|nr:hypothetical protein CVT26_012292 [Gymnopilus dilepis]
MALEEAVNSLRESLQAALDDLLSPRSSAHTKLKALRAIERHFGNAIFDTKNDAEAKDAFLALQYTFECNVPLHLLSWITLSTAKLEALTSKASADDTTEAEELADQLVLALSIIQGIVLNHGASKAYMGRRSILLDLLLASRHLSPTSDNSSDSNPKSGPPPLTSIVLDTLLCILVDSSTALRVFEQASGVQAVVKILKRAGTPREVRMKCLEFLYFYLLDETPTTSSDLKLTQPSPSSPPPLLPPTRPATPIKPPKPYLNATPLRPPTSRYGSSTYSFSSSGSSASAGGLSVSSSSSASGSSRSASGSSSKSFSSTSSNASSDTAASSAQASPVKESFPPVPPLPRSASKPAIAPRNRFTTPTHTHSNLHLQLNSHRTPPNSPPFSSGAGAGAALGSGSSSASGHGSASKPPQLRSMMMLRKEVDYVPQSPKKYSGLGVRPTHRKSTSTPVNLNPRSLLSAAELANAEAEGRSASAKSPTTRDKLEERSVSSYVLHSSPIAKSESFDSASASSPSSALSSPRVKNHTANKHEGKPLWKTTEQKKEFLGTMLGNVDALVEGVRKAGIWGLG